METHDFNQYEQVSSVTGAGDVAAKTFTARVFSWMFLGLGITGLLAYVFASTPALFDLIYTPGIHRGLSGLGIFVSLAPLGLCMLIGFRLNSLSYGAMVGIFLLFSALFGMSLSAIFFMYTSGSLFTIFFITAGMFGVMALLGYTTSTDLTKFGSLLMMLLFGGIIAMFVNYFMHSAALDYGISFLFVAVFTGLTAYDVQKIKQIGSQIDMNGGDATVGKMSILGALTLYLDFINLFLALLRIFGSRK
jgi:FtsH-binding integral membrane protein